MSRQWHAVMVDGEKGRRVSNLVNNLPLTTLSARAVAAKKLLRPKSTLTGTNHTRANTHANTHTHCIFFGALK